MNKNTTFFLYLKKFGYLFLKKIGSIISFVLPPQIIDGIRVRKIAVKNKKKKIFNIEDMGRITRYRANTFSRKEPETIKWIESFSKEDVFLDVGANIGIFTLFAISRGHYVVAVEPEAQNFCLLNRNIHLNNFDKMVTTLCLALNDTKMIADLNLSSLEYGAALHSFGRSITHHEKEFIPTNKQTNCSRIKN
mgnify:CR=1 FL=1